MSLANLSLDSNRALTFRIGDTLFGIDVCNILAFSDEYADIRSPTRRVEGFAGYLDYRERLVKVFECATVLNRGRERDGFKDLIDEIDQHKFYHNDWFDALERSIKQQQPFTEACSPTAGAFGRWYYSFESGDEGLSALVEKLEEPHREIHRLGDRLLEMADQGEQAQALEVLAFERPSLLRKVDRLLMVIRNYLLTSVHPVVLHLTKDGLTPWFSLVLDEIDDIVDYDPDWIDRTSGSALGNEPVAGYIRHRDGDNFMMLAIEKLYGKLSGLVDEPEAAH